MSRLRHLSLKTKLLLTMLSLLVLSVSSLFLLHLYSEQRLLKQVKEYTEDFSTTLEVFQEQPVGQGAPAVVLKDYMDKLGQLGVQDVSITDSSEVQASTNPKNVGKPLLRTAARRGPKEFVIRGVLGEESGPPGKQQTTTLTMPIVLGDRRVGYLLITRYLDDFSALSHQAFLSRLLATLAVFSFGFLLALYLSWSFSRPLQALTQAARQVAAGDLSVQVPAGGTDEIGSLARTFNEMVERLREHRRLEERLHFAERSTAMGRLASAMAHEIRNPLNFINLSIDHVRERLAPNEVARRDDFDRILANVKAEISRLNRLVGDFLSFGKPMRLHPRSCDLAAVLKEVAALVDHKARDQGIALAFEAEAGLPEVVVDPELLKTCFLNLMINAVDAMGDGGLLTVGVAAAPGGEGVEVEVRDTGRGMTPEQIESAFEPYFSTKDTGLGLGLALTRKIVEDHGGRIELTSAPGRGTLARIRLPRAAALAEPEVVGQAGEGMKGRVLIVDDEKPQRDILHMILEADGYEAATAGNGRQALERARSQTYDAVLTDLKMPDLSGIDLLTELMAVQPGLCVILMTAHGTIDSAVTAMRKGAFDYLTKPLEKDELLLVLGRAMERTTLVRENRMLQEQLRDKFRVENIVGSHGAMHDVFRVVHKVAASNSTVLIYGESGTGKELVARALHHQSDRRHRPFYAVNAAALPESILEAELFGYEKGAFTGADARKIGLFEQASGSTLFLDEVGDLKRDLQVKLLRTLQEREILRVGGTERVRVDVRIVAATNQDLEREVREGRFREDLYYRLNVIPIVLPSLRERRTDIPLLVDHFVAKYAGERRRGVSRGALEILVAYDWPGNVRELESVIERALLLGEQDEIVPEDLPNSVRARVSAPKGAMDLEIPDSGIDLEAVERSLLLKALEKAGGNVSRAARLLGLSRRTLQYRMSKLQETAPNGAPLLPKGAGSA